MRRVTRRVPGSGPAAFGLGLEFRLFLDSIGLRGIGGFAFAAVLERFLSRSATINSFAETVLEDGTGETIARWPARLGTHQIV
jgi:type VI secretion system protein ImpG